MLVSMKDMLQHALRDGYAVGQFNINNLEWVGAVLSTGQQLRSPIILGVSGGTVKHMLGLKCIHDIVVNAMDYLHIDIPVALHLDHGTTREACEAAIEAGFSSIMFDGSHLPFSENLAITRHLVALAHSKGISVEAELGTIAGSEDGIVNSAVIYADPEECYTLVKETQVDCLAAALGSTHGLYKGKAKLGFTEMKAISERVNVPLVLHGGTGIADDDIRKAIACGTAKINVNTENMYAWCQEVKALFAADTGHDVNDPRKVINQGLKPVREMIARRIALFGSQNRY
ncbi:TPA: class II fructose-1,6-bisphosphate aldolase [Klebsiella oxytoca]|uniref:class II fructose-1,6-bisphosphate aldolase n=1 Tax=Klebsiella oxytoca TaxID=571 RepID=UPI00024FFEE9|nr:class II fructose-1,6-bisphosphate aldolase [Klebsiella oxytoca]EHT01744.1 fructose-1,6-bisphosphate aldolase, class II [Klebsiella oxytoca 10-5243]ELD4399121.1 class II fructose-1,6-bisphosphate aldolase [Klebsiella oxytoca]HCF8138817.1 class II fructose-1,6-bisphosphate aldolase [Klebsiella oxytoca]